MAKTKKKSAAKKKKAAISNACRMATKSVSDAILALTEKLAEKVEKLADEVEDLPQNEKITELSGNAFVVKFSDLRQDGWAPETHDFRIQYRELAKKIRSNQPSQALNVLRLAVIEGKFLAVGQTSWIRLHPVVVEHLRKLLPSQNHGNQTKSQAEVILGRGAPDCE